MLHYEFSTLMLHKFYHTYKIKTKHYEANNNSEFDRKYNKYLTDSASKGNCVFGLFVYWK